MVTSSSDSAAMASTSAPSTQAGRLRNWPAMIWLMIWAWILTPGTASPSGVTRMSCSPAADTPTSTMAPSIFLASALPARTSAAEMTGVVASGAA